jgi:hypothetical protein
MTDHIVQKWACSTCGNIHDKEYDAEKCCPNRAEERWVCQICDERFWDEPESKEHVHTIDELTPTEIYLDALRFDPVPPLGEWEVTMRKEMEFLIPYETA